jgi:uncharacterized BrkB/YihY/UPF0761 family membrane protein
MDSSVKRIIDKIALCLGVAIALFAFLDVNPNSYDGFYGALILVIGFVFFLAYRIGAPLRTKIIAGNLKVDKAELSKAFKWHPALIGGVIVYCVINLAKYFFS